MERFNQIIEVYLKVFINWDQGNQVKLLPFAEFCYNNVEYSTMKQIPFYVVYGCHTTNNFPIVATVENPVAEAFIKNLTEI